MEQPSNKQSAIKTWGSRAYRWLVLALALTMLTLSVMKLKLTPEAWTNPVCELADKAVELIPDPVACSVLSGTIIATWLVRDRANAVGDAVALTIWFIGAPGIHQVYTLIKRTTQMGISAFIRTEIQESREKGVLAGHAEGHAQGHAEGQAQAHAKYQKWLERRFTSGTFTWDDDDPPCSGPESS